MPSAIPLEALEYCGIGVTAKDGTFKLQCKGEPGAVVGENQVLVTEAQFPRELMGASKQVALAKYIQSLGNRPLPRQYTNFTNNPLVVNVEPGKKSYKIELKLGLILWRAVRREAAGVHVDSQGTCVR